VKDAPIVTASFVLDAQQHLQTIQQQKYVHYRIKLNILDYPPSTYAVTYRLHQSYRNPIREIRSPGVTEGFPLNITTYGDFDVRAEIRTSERSYRISRRISEALRATYSQARSPEIEKAIEQIAGH
jgi:YEATS family